MASLLFLVASGLTLIFGVGNVFNFAHGSFYMLGAYFGYQLVSVWQANFWLSLVLAGLGVGVFGMLVEALFLRRIYGRANEGGFQILLTYCFILIIDDLVKLVWGTEYKSLPRPRGFHGAVQLGDLYLPAYNLLIIAIGLVVVVLAWWILSKTRPGILKNNIVYYYFLLILVLVSIWVLKRMAYSPFGMMLRCVRQNPERVRSLGRRVRRNQLRIYMVSCFFASLAGALAVGIDNSIHTDMLFWTTSGEVILMSVLGGISQFFGPFVGAGCIIVIEDIVGAYTEYWSLIIGTVILVMVIAFPKGIVGEALRLRERWGKKEPSP